MIIKQKHNKGHQVIVNKDVQAMYLVGLWREGGGVKNTDIGSKIAIKQKREAA